jgi:choline kinase
MKGIILAAGRGSRLGSATAMIPKPMIEVGGQRCIDFALAALGPVCDEVIVVTGYQAEQIEAHVAQACAGRSVHTLRNPTPEAGNLTTLLAARAAIGDDGFIVTNADHLFPADMYQRHFPPGEAIRIAAERGRTILDDEMKVVERGGRLVRISKTLPEFDGAYIGTTAVSAAAAAAYWQAFDQVLGTADTRTASVEMVLGELARQAHTSPRLCWIEGLTWYEVDNAEDLAVARAGLGW